MSNTRRWTSFVLLSVTGGIIFQVSYIRFVFLEETYTALNLSAQEYGNIISIFGGTAMVMYFFGGWFADKFHPKKLIAVALALTGIADLYLATAPGYAGVLTAHMLMAVAGMALYWSALIKAIGMLGSASEQGRLFGFLEGARGLTSTIVGFIGTAVVAAAIIPAEGVLALIRIYGVLCFVLAGLVWFFVQEGSQGNHTSERSAVTLAQLVEAAKNKYTWLIGGTVMLMYCFYTTLGYFSPLLSNEFGVGVALLGIIGVVRTYVFQFVAGPVGGVVVDKVTHSAPRFLRWMFIVALIIAALFVVLPRSPELMPVAVILMFALTFAVFMSRGVYWATVGEIDVPESQRGGMIGLASGLAYLPDAFLPSIVAWLIGDPAAATPVPEQGGGYTTLFIILVVVALLGVALTTLTTRMRRTEVAHATRQEHLPEQAPLPTPIKEKYGNH